MERSPEVRRSATRWILPVLALATLLPSTGCLHLLVASGIYFWEGGNLVPAECNALEKKRVVVFCRAPASHDFRHAGASRAVAKRVSEKLEMNVPGIEVVDSREVDNWIDENDSDDSKKLAEAVKADMVVHIELETFELYKGKTLLQGDAVVTVNVLDMKDRARRIWDRNMGQVLFPRNSGIPLQDKPVPQFQNEYIEVLSERIAENFYKHDPNASFAIDALANR